MATIAELASASENFTTLVTALKAADLVETLNGDIKWGRTVYSFCSGG